jgi:uncharacterized membrane protein YdcZ (DUF606 family)
MENIYAFASLLFAITLLIIIMDIRKKNLEDFRSALKNPLWPRTKMSFFVSLYKTYYKEKGLNIVIFVNVISFIVGFIGLVIIFYKAVESNLF